MRGRAGRAAVTIASGVCLAVGWTAAPLRASEPAAPVELVRPVTPVVGPAGFEHLPLPTASAVQSPVAVEGPPAEPPQPPHEPVALASPPTPVPTTPAAATGTGTWALVVGVDDYPGTESDLRGAVADALDAEAALAAFGAPTQQRLVLTGAAAKGAAVRDGVEWLVANAGPEATPVVYLAGHVRRPSPGRHAFRSADGGLLRDSELASLLDRLQAPRLWLAVAGCYGAGFDEVVDRPGRILTAASGADEIAYENTSLGRSYLGEYMVRRAMLGGRLSSIRAAFTAADAAIAYDFPHRRPVLVDGGGDINL